MAAGFALQTLGLETTTPSNSGFITGMTVVLIPFASWVVYRRPLSRLQCVSFLLAAVGLGFLTLRGVQVLRGDGWTLLCAVAFSGHVLVLAVVGGWGDVRRITVLQLGVVSVCALAWSVVQGDAVFPGSEGSVWGALVVTGVLATAVAYMVQSYAQRVLEASRVALFFSAEPVVGALCGVLWAGDRFTLFSALGAVLVVVAMVLAEWGERSLTEMAAAQYCDSCR